MQVVIRYGHSHVSKIGGVHTPSSPSISLCLPPFSLPPSIPSFLSLPFLPSVLWRCWLGHFTRKNHPRIPDMTNMFGGTLNLAQLQLSPLLPYLGGPTPWSQLGSGGATPGRTRSNDLAGRSTALAQLSPGSALPSPAYCFASVIVWTENKNVTISDRFICFILTLKRRWRPVFRGRQL